MKVEFEDNRFIRLSDRILFALKLALEQEDVPICEKLVTALEMSMTRNTGGGEFIERRDYPPEVEEVMDKLDEIKKRKSENEATG